MAIEEAVKLEKMRRKVAAFAREHDVNPENLPEDPLEAITFIKICVAARASIGAIRVWK
jgi:hypothetical protein